MSLADSEQTDTAPRSLWGRLKAGLGSSSKSLSQGLKALLVNRKPNAATLDEIEDLLIMSDVGVDLSASIVDDLRRQTFDPSQGMEPVLKALAQHLDNILASAERPFIRKKNQGEPEVILCIGVNGAGKTTTLGKLASKLSGEGYSVMLAAADTFRAAAIEQLKAWGERSGVDVISAEAGSDPSALVFRALEAARGKNVDYLLIDTAGRLHNKSHLMEELGKIRRVISKQIDDAPHQVLLVLDATTGQNALLQAEAFAKVANVTGLIMTKLDGSAKGGVLIALTHKYGLPISMIGIGEKTEDLIPFQAKAFSRALIGLEDNQ